MFPLKVQIVIAFRLTLGGTSLDHFGLKAIFWFSALIVIFGAFYLAAYGKKSDGAGQYFC